MTNDQIQRSILFAGLAVQLGFVARDSIAEAISIWSEDKSVPLTNIFLEKSIIDPVDHAILEALVQRHLERYDQDSGAALAALCDISDLPQLLHSVNDKEVQVGLSHIKVPVRIAPTAADSSHYGKPERFQVERLLATGGNAEVLIARDFQLLRDVALKRLRTDRSEDSRQLLRLKTEAEIIGRLEHAGVVPVYGTQAGGSDQFSFAMRWVRGHSFDKAIATYHDRWPQLGYDQRQVELRRLLGSFLDVCHTIEYAHSRGVLHRDVKPDNVMKTQFGETLLVDWGLARICGRPLGNETQNVPPIAVISAVEGQPSVEGEPIGTPAYMAPEQASGQIAKISAATDVFGLGATLYHVLTGRAPYHGADTTTSLRLAQSADFVRPRSINVRIPVELESICLRAMALDPAQRYSSARAVADDVERWLAGLPIESAKASVLRYADRGAKRHPFVAAAAAAAIAALIFSPLAAWWGAHRAQPTIVLKPENPVVNDAVSDKSTGSDEEIEPTDKETVRRGIELYKLDMYAEARDAFSEAIAKNPDGADAWGGRGLAHCRLEAWEAAVDDFNQAEQRYKTPTEYIYTRRAEALMELDRYEEAVADLSRSIELESNSYSHYRDRASCYDKLGRFTEAIKDLTQAIDMRPRDAGLYVRRANVRQRLGVSDPSQHSLAVADRKLAYDIDPTSVDTAIATLTNDIDENPNNTEALTGRSAFFSMIDEVGKAIADISRVIELLPEDPEPLNARIAYRLRSGDLSGAADDVSVLISLQPAVAGHYSLRASINERRERWQDSVDDYTRAMELDPDNSAHWNNRGNVYFKLEDWNRSLADYRKALELTPDDAIIWANAGSANRQLENWQAAIEDYSKALEINSDLATAWYGRGVAKTWLENQEGAVNDYTEAINRDDSVFGYWSDRGHSHRLLGLLQFAVRDYSRAVEINNAAHEIWNYRGICQFQLGEIELAEADFDRALRLAPDVTLYVANRGIARKGLRRFADSIVDLDSAIEAHPQNAQFIAERGLAFFGIEDIAKAHVDFSRAIELDPQNAEYYNYRAMLSSEMQEWDKSITDFDVAIEIAPTRADLFNGRGAAKSRAGYREAALADFTHAIAIDRANELYRRNHGAASAQNDQWEQSLDDYRFIKESASTNPLNWFELLIVLRHEQKEAEFQETLTAMQKQFAETTEPDVVYQLINACAELNQEMPGNETVERLLAVIDTDDGPRRLSAHGMAMYRLGKHDESVATLTKAYAEAAADAWRDAAFLALAHHHLDDLESAAHWLQTAEEQRQAEIDRLAESKDHGSAGFFRRLRIDFLWSEVSKIEPSD